MIEKELDVLRYSNAQLIESEETTKSKLANVKANNAQLIQEKEKEIAELNEQIREYANRVLPVENLIGGNPQLSLLVDVFHRKASRKKNTSLPLRTDWTRLVHLFSRSQPAAFAAIGRESVLSPQELRACILLLLHFSNGEIISLLDITPQRMTNVRTSINEKLFKETNAHSLDRNLENIAIV